MGEALVTPKEGFVKIYAINSTPENIELIIPTVELEEFEIIDHDKLSLNKNDPYIERSSSCKKDVRDSKIIKFRKT